MADLSTLKKGDPCFVSNTDKRQYHHRSFAAKVRSVGSRYITTTNGMRFSLDGYGEYGFRLYVSQQHRDDEWAAEEIAHRIVEHMQQKGRSLPLMTLREVAQLLGVQEVPND